MKRDMLMGSEMMAEDRATACVKGYENGIGAMSADDRTTACVKGNENGIGAMSAKVRTAASEKGYENMRSKFSESAKARYTGRCSPCAQPLQCLLGLSCSVQSKNEVQ